jgi:hypothetical protein
VKVQIPSDEGERSHTLQIAAVALGCFVVGLAWPSLAGLRLVPEVPVRAQPSSAPAEPSPAQHRASEAVPVAKTEPLLAGGELQASVSVKDSLTVACRDASDKKLAKCDKPGFDETAEPRLKALLACEAVRNASGTLSIGFELDFVSEKISRIVHGKSTTFNDTVTKGLLECARREFMSATLRGVKHTHPNYLQFYVVQFLPPSVAGGTGQEAIVPVTGSATVIWNSARVRAQPVEGGEVRTQILYGTRLVVSARQGDWYRVRYDAKGTEGWIHKNALAM